MHPCVVSPPPFKNHERINMKYGLPPNHGRSRKRIYTPVISPYNTGEVANELTHMRPLTPPTGASHGRFRTHTRVSAFGYAEDPLTTFAFCYVHLFDASPRRVHTHASIPGGSTSPPPRQPLPAAACPFLIASQGGGHAQASKGDSWLPSLSSWFCVFQGVLIRASYP